MRKFLKTTVICVFVTCMITTLFAQGANNKTGQFPKRGFGILPNGFTSSKYVDITKKSFEHFNINVAKKLNLTTDQTKKIKNLQTNTLKKTQAQSKIVENDINKYQATRKKAPNAKSTEKEKEKTLKSFADLMKIRNDYDMSLKKLLTKNQLIKLDSIRKEQRSKMRREFGAKGAGDFDKRPKPLNTDSKKTKP